MAKQMQVIFCGGTGTVTGANFLLTVENIKILIDCGLIQGTEYADNLNRTPFIYDPAAIDYLIITHSHIDHIGRVAKLVKDGFKGKIISTPATRDLSVAMLDDCVRVLDEEARKHGVLPIYEKSDVDQAFTLWQDLNYHKSLELISGLNLLFKDSGHILGSAMAEFSYGEKKIVFTGDLGNSPSLLLRDTEPLGVVDYLVMESVYGDRNHEPKDERRRKLKEIVAESISKKKTLLIPAFSLERTQVILYELNEFFESGDLPVTPVFLDSPLAARVTEIYKRYSEDMNEIVKKDIFSGDDIFNFPKLKFTVRADESQAIIKAPNPKIIMAGSGMSNGGRIVQHEKHYLSDKNATIMLVGYQALGTLGRRIQDGDKVVHINGSDVTVRAKIEMISGYSSHKDSDNLLEFVAASEDSLKEVFVVMGELKSSTSLAQKISGNLNVKAICPELNQTVTLDF